MQRLLPALLAMSLLGGCALHTRDGSVIIDPPHHDGHHYDHDDHHRSSGSGFCPPGQAKKGNC